MPFLRNCWYMAAWSEEVGRTLLGRTILNEHVLLYRKEDGTPAAISDTCPHRFVPLSLGHLKGDVVECLYHGLRFDGGGKCVLNPHGNRKITPTLHVKSYPVVDRDECIWIWMGDPATADFDRIPNFMFFDRSDPGVRTVRNYLHAPFAYDLLIDNVMDLSHAEFLHAKTFSSGYAEHNAMQVTEEERSVRVSRQLFDIPIPPPFAPIYDPQGNVDQWQETRWMAPGIAEFKNDVVRTGGDRNAGVGSLFNHYATPESEKTTHYFFSISRRHRLDPQFDELYRTKQMEGVEKEDAWMIAAQQKRMGDAEFWSLRPALLETDAAAIKVRRVMERLIREEQPLPEAE